MKHQQTRTDILEDRHLMIDREVSHQLHKETHISHVVEKVRVAELLGPLITQSLLVLARALAVSRNN